MSKLILASNSNFLDIPDLNAHLDIPIEKAKILYVITGSKNTFDDSFVHRHLKRVADRGLNYTSFDIEGKTRQDLSRKLEDFDIIHMEGGNTFHLLKTIKDTHFDKVLRDRINNGLNYIGTSAGSYVMTPSIVSATWNERGFDRFGLKDFNALNFVPFVLKAHYTKDRKQSILENTSDLKWPLRILTDDQAIAVNGKIFKLIGKGEEITLENLQNEKLETT